MIRLGCQFGKRHLVRAECAFHFLAVYHLRTGPTFGTAQHNHRPGHACGNALSPRLVLQIFDFGQHLVECGGHQLVHGLRVVSFDEIGIVAVALEQFPQLLIGQAREDGGVRDLVAVQMQNGQNSAIVDGVQEFVRVPTGRERPGFGFAVADHAAGD